MTATITKYSLGLCIGALMLLLAPFALAEGTSSDYADDRAESKIDLITNMAEELSDIIDAGDAENIDTTKAFADLETGLNSLADAQVLFTDAQYDAAYDAASDAFGVFDRAINSVQASIDKNFSADVKKLEQKQKEIQEECEDEDNVGTCIKQTTKAIHSSACKSDTDDADTFCRDGAVHDKKDAGLNDIMNGFIKAADLNEAQTALIRQEVETLIRQLIVRIMGIL